MDSDCIVWQGAKTSDGYGYTKANCKTLMGDRLALEATLGRLLKPRLCPGHPCDVRECINPTLVKMQDEIDAKNSSLLAIFREVAASPQSKLMKSGTG